MKITVGLAGCKQYPLYAASGADEVFCGYVPESWTRRYGLSLPLNRRETRFFPVQLGGKNELRILKYMRQDLGVPVTLTFNALCYRPEQYEQIACIMEDCAEEGFDTFIVADPGLMVHLCGTPLHGKIRIHVSGEFGAMNRYGMEEVRRLGADRVIFHRRTGIGNMASMIRADREAHPDAPLETEVFVMNEMCHFTGAYCNSLHCDEMAHACHLPWRLAPLERGAVPPPAASPGRDENRYGTPGFSGCGLCALPRLERAGVKVLKVVGRGADPEDMVRDITAVRKALTILNEQAEDGFENAMKEACFPDGCGGNCYYP